MSAIDADEAGACGVAGDLARAVLGICRSTVRLFGFELSEVARRLGRRLALLLVSALFAAVGLLFVLGGLSVLAQEALRIPLWASMTALGLLLAGAGVFGLRAALRRLADRDLGFPATVAELGKDVEALSRRDVPA